jgi:hypothetical protein
MYRLKGDLQPLLLQEARPVNENTGEKIIVLVSDRGDSKHGEISVVDEPRKAEKLVETLLEAGFEQDRIHVFSGRQSEFQVSQRPVVALVGEGEEEEAQAGFATPEVVAAEPEPYAGKTEADGGQGEGGEGEGGEGEEAETGEEVPATAEAGAPVKFSSLFRSA